MYSKLHPVCPRMENEGDFIASVPWFHHLEDISQGHIKGDSNCATESFDTRLIGYCKRIAEERSLLWKKALNIDAQVINIRPFIYGTDFYANVKGEQTGRNGNHTVLLLPGFTGEPGQERTARLIDDATYRPNLRPVRLYEYMRALLESVYDLVPSEAMPIMVRVWGDNYEANEMEIGGP